MWRHSVDPLQDVWIYRHSCRSVTFKRKVLSLCVRSLVFVAILSKEPTDHDIHRSTTAVLIRQAALHLAQMMNTASACGEEECFLGLKTRLAERPPLLPGNVPMRELSSRTRLEPVGCAVTLEGSGDGLCDDRFCKGTAIRLAQDSFVYHRVSNPTMVVRRCRRCVFIRRYVYS